jgi:hypothetical protein
LKLDVKQAHRQFVLGNVGDAKVAAERLLKAVVSGDITREQVMWENFLNEPDNRVKFEAFRLLLSYAYGKPTEKQEVTVDGPGFVAALPDKHDPEEWAKRYAPKAAKTKDGNA